jgi:hypothetical protein
LLALLNPKAVLFIDYDEPQVRVLQALGEQRMGTDQYIDLAVCHGTADRAPDALREPPNDERGVYSRVPQEGPDASGVLSRQEFRWDQHSDLLPPLYGVQSRQECHEGLPGSDITLE